MKNRKDKIVDVTSILQAEVDKQGGVVAIPASNVKLTYNHPGHDPGCTWPCYEQAGEQPPGQSMWGQINYKWCQHFCHSNPVKPKLWQGRLTEVVILVGAIGLIVIGLIGIFSEAK